MKKWVRKIVVVVLLLILSTVASSGIIYAIYNKPLPVGQSGPKADALAQKMLKAVNHEAYRNTRYLEWSFRNGNHIYKWDKAAGKVDISWNGYSARLDLNRSEESRVFDDKGELLGSKKEKLVKKAISLFNNDSFWLVAPYKVFDQGTKRSVVLLEDGTEALMVSYTSGGSTPGDSYLWKLGPNGFPESFEMWVKIIPVGGLEASWDDWQIVQSGAFLPKSHAIGPIKLTMGEVKGYIIRP